jgi:hypothetical protein
MAATTVNLDKKRRAAKCEIVIAYWSSWPCIAGVACVAGSALLDGCAGACATALVPQTVGVSGSRSRHGLHDVLHHVLARISGEHYAGWLPARRADL